MFWIPQGWVPYYAEWMLSFPRAPLGSVSIQAWLLACTAIVILVSDAIAAVFALVMDSGVGSVQRRKGEAMEFSGEKAGSGQSPTVIKTKKDL